ncbi:MAG: response regulator, partial [Gemmatimonadales bacterium]
MSAEGDTRAVLVVDDEESIRNPLKKFLEQQKFEVHAAASAAEALGVLRSHKIHVALFDIRMPGTSGIDLVPQALEVDPDLAILMLSAVNDATTAALCMQRGALDYLTKPIELVDLNRAVQRALKRRDMALEGQKLQQWLRDEVKSRGAEVGAEQQKLHQLQVATLEALINA